MTVDEINIVLKFFDNWVSQFGLPNKTKPLRDITSAEYKKCLFNFYNYLNLNISFKNWIESFYSMYEIDFDYLDLMKWEDWFKLYLKVLTKYVKEGVITVNGV